MKKYFFYSLVGFWLGVFFSTAILYSYYENVVEAYEKQSQSRRVSNYYSTVTYMKYVDDKKLDVLRLALDSEAKHLDGYLSNSDLVDSRLEIYHEAKKLYRELGSGEGESSRRVLESE